MWSADRIPQLHFQLSKLDRYFFIQVTTQLSDHEAEWAPFQTQLPEYDCMIEIYKTIIVPFVYMVSHITGRTQTQIVWKQIASENIWTQDI
jgi:hypothetical protein